MRTTNQKGFMLIQVLMGAALLGVLGLAFASLMRNMMMENQGIQSKASELALIQALTQQVSNSTLCMKSLVDKSYTPAKALQIKLNETDPDSAAVAAGTTLSNWGLQVVNFNYANATKVVDSFNGFTVYMGDMELEARALTGKKMAYAKKSIGKLLFRVRDANQTIVSCYTEESGNGATEQICQALNGTLNGNKCDLTAKIKNEVTGAVGVCPADQALLGFSGNGDRICGAIPNKLMDVGSCPGGQTLTGFDGNGNKICGVLPQPVPPPAVPNYCVSNSGSRNCCGSGGSCVKTGEVTEHIGGGRGGFDTTIPVYMCFCG